MTNAAAPTAGAPPATTLVAIVGRPNVGKSSLFNALLGRRSAIVAEESGTTRDRMIAPAEFEGRHFLLADTGGLLPEPETEIEAHIAAQVDAAIAGADAVIFVTDARTGPAYADEYVAQRLRQAHKPTVVAVNKADNPSQESLAADAYALSLGEPVPVSALHRRGLGDLMDALMAQVPMDDAADAPDPETPRIAIIGRPNVGKSALTNAVLHEERSIVSPVPGTTRDALDTPFEFEGAPAVLIDTAGIRRRGAVQPGIEKFSVLRAAAAIHRCDVALLVLDATNPTTDQDLHIAGQAADAFKSLLVVVNKWDLVEHDDPRREERRFTRLVRSRMRFLPNVPVAFTSAIDGGGVPEALRMAFDLHAKRTQWVDGPAAEPRGDGRRLAPPPAHQRGEGLAQALPRQAGVRAPAHLRLLREQHRSHPLLLRALPRQHHPGAVRLRRRAAQDRVPGQGRRARHRRQPLEGCGTGAARRQQGPAFRGNTREEVGMEWLLVPAAYLLGSVQPGLLLVRLVMRRDVREVGSGKTGMTNVMRAAGKKAAALVFVLDVAKGVLPVLVAASVSDDAWLEAATATVVVVGHVFPVFAGFRGGRGVATGVRRGVGAAPVGGHRGHRVCPRGAAHALRFAGLDPGSSGGVRGLRRGDGVVRPPDPALRIRAHHRPAHHRHAPRQHRAPAARHRTPHRPARGGVATPPAASARLTDSRQHDKT